MPRHLRLDAPNTQHHVMVRGIERTTLFRDDADPADFVARRLVMELGLSLAQAALRVGVSTAAVSKAVCKMDP